MLYNYNEVKSSKYHIVCVCVCVCVCARACILAQITLNEIRIHMAPYCVRLWNVILMIISVTAKNRQKFIIFMTKSYRFSDLKHTWIW